METINVRVVCANGAKVPIYSTENSAACDLYAVVDGVVNPGCRSGCIPTGLIMEIPPGYYGNIEPRSGLAHRFGISVLGGIIDSDFRGEIKILLLNNGEIPYKYNAGDRIAQLLFKKYAKAQFTIVDSLCANTHEGFGSTGV